MNHKLFNELMKKQAGLSQNPPEWEMYLQICEAYIKKHKIAHPIVVELGTLWNQQKPFYEQLLGAQHIGIDSETSRGKPDIIGFTDRNTTMQALKARLNGRMIDILFIDASHRYHWVKADFERYSPLCNGIVAFHDIEAGRDASRCKHEVFKLWDELKELSYAKEGNLEFTNHLFISIRQCRKKKGRSGRMGIGLMIKR